MGYNLSQEARILRVLIVIIFILVSAGLGGYEVAQLSRTYLDEERDNRQIGVEIFYPVSPERDTTFSLLVFGHGWLINYGSYTGLADWLVSAGYIMAFPVTEGGFFPSHNNFALDQSFCAQAIAEENDITSSPLFGIIGASTVVMGHSMGGGCSMLSEEEFSGFDAVINFAAAETTPSAIFAAAGVLCPTLIFSAANDLIAPPASHQMPIYQATAADYKAFISLNNEGHLGITGNEILPELLLPFLAYIGSGDQEFLAEFEDNLEILASDDLLEYLLETPIWEHIYGDTDDNGEVEAFDAALVMQYAVGIDPAPAAPLPWESWRLIAADVSGNMEIDAYDAALILQFFTGIINFFPAETALLQE
jgi:hypothetical protein